MPHTRYMQRCIDLALMGSGAVAPNPMVGAVLVHKDVIIGEGYHRQWGSAHAEVNCINAVLPEHQHLIPESVLYVSLEPCAHFGKTPPCTQLIISKGIQQVVVGCRDPFKQVAGKGIEQLKAVGIQVTVGVLEEACIGLNKRFFTFQLQQRPYITLKWAQTADGKIAHKNYSPVRISNDCTNRLVHQWRSQEMGLLVGTNTALFDNPQLTTRLWPGKNPIRLVLDAGLRLPVSLKLFDGEHKTIVFNYIQQSDHYNLVYHRLTPAQNIVQQIATALHQYGINSVLVEGGAQLLQSFIDAQLWDEAKVITNEQMTMGCGIAAPILNHHKLSGSQTIFTDVIRSYTRQ